VSEISEAINGLRDNDRERNDQLARENNDLIKLGRLCIEESYRKPIRLVDSKTGKKWFILNGQATREF